MALKNMSVYLCLPLSLFDLIVHIHYTSTTILTRRSIDRQKYIYTDL